MNLAVHTHTPNLQVLDARGLHSDTPTLRVVDPRAFQVRSVAYWRAVTSQEPQGCITRTAEHAAGRVVTHWDPRLWAAQTQSDETSPANLKTFHSLSGRQLLSDSVDGGWCLDLLGEAAQVLFHWDGRGTERRCEYDAQLRPTAIVERSKGQPLEPVERFVYGGAEQTNNGCGRLICHDTPAGTLQVSAFGMNGAVLEQAWQFCGELPRHVTRSEIGPLGSPVSLTDAKGNQRRFSQGVDGALSGVQVCLSGSGVWLPVMLAASYNAWGEVEREAMANGLWTSLEYDAASGRLARIYSRRIGGDDVLQDLRYLYDPVGNVVSIEDKAQATRSFANQRIDPINTYRYDTLYRLIQARGWEAGAVKHGPFSPPPSSTTPGNYVQTYEYDLAGNLLQLTHVGPQNHGHRLVAAPHSNRCLPVRDGVEPGEEDFHRGFDARGNLLGTQAGQLLAWGRRNQISEVRTVKRDTGVDDRESYEYGPDGMRISKLCSLHGGTQVISVKTLYLPGLELRTHSGTGEVLQVLSIPTARSSLRLLHWVVGKPRAINNDQQRYSLTDHLNSGTLELDQEANILTQEFYYPFGGTAWADVDIYKVMRYAGKEQDATGFYYYDARYYIPWMQRWLSPDPLGSVDGLNLYAMVLNNPVTFIDRAGTDTNIPRQLNWVWMGAPLPVNAAMNINNFVEQAPGYSATLWVDNQSWSSGHGAALENLGKSVHIRNVSDIFQGVDPRVHAAFERERSGPLRNYAAASDIARLALISKGGVYSDVDVELAKPFPSSLSASFGGMLLNVEEDEMLVNAVLAGRPGAPAATRALRQIASEYSTRSSSTWVKKRAFPDSAELAAQKIAKASALKTMERQISSMDSRLQSSDGGRRIILQAQLEHRRGQYAQAQEADPSTFLHPQRVAETVRITGPALIFSSLKGQRFDSFSQGQFKPIDGGGQSMNRSGNLRRASFS